MAQNKKLFQSMFFFSTLQGKDFESQSGFITGTM